MALPPASIKAWAIASSPKRSNFDISNILIINVLLFDFAKIGKIIDIDKFIFCHRNQTAESKTVTFQVLIQNKSPPMWQGLIIVCG
jgi:hypothetical protein